MKKIYTIIAALAIATGATAQSFTVHTKCLFLNKVDSILPL